MGQKVSPTGLRIGINKDWESKWYAPNKDFAKYLNTDIKIREYLEKNLKGSSVSMPLAPGSLASVFGLGTCPMLTPMWFLRDLMMFTLAAFLLSRFRPALYAFGLFCLFLHR